MEHIEGQAREQAILFPEALDDLIALDHPVRVIDAFVESLDLAKLGFERVEVAETGRPPYHPGDLLKLYLWGYMNQIRSSRRLARETLRNIEVLWLLNRLSPVFKTIAQFRKDHSEAILGVFRAFVQFCGKQGLIGGEAVAIDGTKIQAVASRKQVLTSERIAKEQTRIDARILEYLEQMDEADAVEREEQVPSGKVQQALQALRSRRKQLEEVARRMAEEGIDQQVVSEPEGRLMRSAQGSHQVSYNAQIAVDGQHKLIVACDLTNECNDQRQLYPMAQAAKESLQVEHLSVVADVGYSNGEQGAKCEQMGVTPIVPRAQTVNPRGDQYFTRSEFMYDPASDSWRCPAGQTLMCRRVSRTQQKRDYWTEACGSCLLKAQCTGAAKRVIVRSFHEAAMEAMHQRAQQDPLWMQRRREWVEHPIGTLKWMMGRPRFLSRGLKNAKTEFALSVLTYNLKRVINIVGVRTLLAAWAT